MGKPRVQYVQDAKTGELYLMYDIDVANWPGGQPTVVYECPVCHGRFPPVEWSHGCPGCAKKKGDSKPKKKWTLTEE